MDASRYCLNKWMHQDNQWMHQTTVIALKLFSYDALRLYQDSYKTSRCIKILLNPVD